MSIPPDINLIFDINDGVEELGKENISDGDNCNKYEIQ
jgi:hypothetical protein